MKFMNGRKIMIGCTGITILRRNILTLLFVCLSISLFIGGNAWATTISFSDSGVRYWEVVETASDAYGWVASPSNDDSDMIDISYEVVGTKLTYDVYNNTNFTINGFAVGVDDFAGQGAENEESHEGWSGQVVNKFDQTDLDSYWTTYLNNYSYAYYAHVYEQVFEPGDSDYSPAGDPLHPFTGITDEFSFTYDDGTLSSPLILFATDNQGGELILTGESSHVMGENRQYVTSAPVPEPATMLLFGTGLVGLVGSRIRKKSNTLK